MKKILQTLAVVTFSGIIFSACSKPYEPVKKDPDIDQSNPLRGDFECYLYDGSTHYVADEKSVTDITKDGSRTLAIHTKEYSDSMDVYVYKTISFGISNFQGTGTYPIDFYTNVAVTLAYDSANIQTFTQVSNEPETFINITKAENDQYEGEFQFKIKNTKDTSTVLINRGKFKLEK